MAADTVLEPRRDGRGSQSLETSVASTFDPTLDPTIRSLFEQQAAIQAKLAALLPKHDHNGKLELDMLRHKLAALEAYAEDQSRLFGPSYVLFCLCLLLPPLITAPKISQLRGQSGQMPKKPECSSISASASRAPW